MNHVKPLDWVDFASQSASGNLSKDGDASHVPIDSTLVLDNDHAFTIGPTQACRIFHVELKIWNFQIFTESRNEGQTQKGSVRVAMETFYQTDHKDHGEEVFTR